MEAPYQPGDMIQDRYCIVGILGEGGSAITYEAIDTTQSDLAVPPNTSLPPHETAAHVALKVLSFVQTKDWKLVEMFEREAKVLKNLHHPRIPAYLDYFSIDTERDRQFILVQELIPGQSLGTLVEQGYYFQEREVKNIAQQVLEILTYLHGFQPPVIHRDIKPHNIIRTESGEIYLVDLGAVQDVYRNTLTRGATFVGTIDYMSPEQLRGHASYGCDLYSLGCTLLYLLTRRSPSELPLKRMKLDFRSSLSISTQFADWLDTVLEPALEDRFRSTTEALEKLHAEKLFVTQTLAGSNIKVSRKQNRLMLKIPAPKALMSLSLIGMIAELAIALVATIILFPASFSLLYLLFTRLNFLLLIVTFSVLALLLVTIRALVARGGSILFCFWGKIYLTLQPQKFRLIWYCWGIKHEQLGNTASIQAVSLKSSSKKASGLMPAAEYCVIYEGIQEHKFAMWLTTAEKRWLASEIASFVIEQYPKKKQEPGLQNTWQFD
ncbi:MAG: serine/threonine-protein kinase [Cyanobacteria bacterium J06623_7]